MTRSKPTLPGRLGRFTPAALVRSLAGIPAGAQPTRRGTVLVLILGALALISVVTLVYAAIGQGDRRAAAVVQIKDTTARGVEFIGNYLAGVIGDDVLDVFVDGERLLNGNQVPILVREATDYPFTDAYRISIYQYTSGSGDTFSGFPRGSRAFNNTGTFFDRITSATDPRLASDPWLARLEPERVIDTGSAPNPAELRDWGQISNFAPDGRFINLFNLRNNFGSSAGFIPGNGPDRFNPGQISAYLTLSDPTTGVPYDADIEPQTLANGEDAHRNIPAHWTMYQVGAYRPINGSTFAVDDPNWTGYQWADADGDGFADSRWFELVDAWDQPNIVHLMPRDENLRWFIAARAIDLSGLAPVNTGTDAIHPAMSTTVTPPDVLPHGLIPEIDLRRLFTMADIYKQYGAGYEQTVDPSDPTDPYGSATEGLFSTIGEAAYATHRHVLTPERTEVPDDTFNPAAINLTGDQRFLLFSDYARSRNFGNLSAGNERGTRTSGPFGTTDLLELLTYFSVNDPSTTSRLEQTLGGRGTPNLSLLRDNRTLDQEMRLRAELQMREYDPTQPEELWSFNRLAFDVRHLITPISGARPIRADVRDQNNKFHLSGSELRIDPRPALELTATTGAAPSSIFRGYTKALMPYAGVLNAWTSRTATTPHQNQTLYFGFDPEIALRTAAHLTANLIDSFDHDDYLTNPGKDKRTGLRVLLKHGANPGVDSPYPILDLDEDLPTGAPQDTYRLAPNSDQVYAVPGNEYIDVFGIEAQPFLAQVTSYVLYTDASSPNGDSEIPGEPITIRGKVTTVRADTTPYPTDNKDFLGEVLAFQLVNPFDRDIDLSNYYLRYGEGDYFFKLTGSLSAGQARVYYVPSCTDIETRWRTVDANLQPGVFELWAKRQLTITDSTGNLVDPVLIEKYTDPATVHSLAVDFFESPTGNKHKMGTIYLWYDAPEGVVGDPWDRDNILIDRLADTMLEERTYPILDVRMPEGNNDITGTDAGDPSDADGMSIVISGTIKRHDDPAQLSGASIPLGALPAYCIEPRDEPDGTGGWLSIIRNPVDQKPGHLITPAESDFDPPYGGREPADILTPTTIPVFVDTIAQHPDDKALDFLPDTRTDLNDAASPTIPFAGQLSPQFVPPRHPEILLNNNKFEKQITIAGQPPRTISTLRVTDMLLPLGIGPMSAPVPPPAAGDIGDPYPGWLTLGEALSMALNYTTFETTITDANNPRYVFQPYRDIGRPLTGALDRGQLVLEDFAPFEDVNTDGLYDAGDRRRAPGIPLALNVLNTFTTLPNQDALTQRTPGLVNINTMPVSVGRLIGLLSPTTENGGAVHDTWKQEADIVPSGARDATVPETTSDIATSLVAYRDQVNLFDREGNQVNYIFRSLTPPPNSTASPPAGFPDWGSAIPGIRGRLWDAASSTPVAGASGFGSIGEIMCAIRRTERRTPLLQSDALFPTGIDFLGFDQSGGNQADSGTEGMLTGRYKPAGATLPGTLKPDEMPNNYAEKLLLASGVLNSVTVRSDVFAVWFVVHGYSRQDCEDLAPTDPLVPSVAKRFVMVIDRSNVTRKGEKPRIVMFTEVPM